MARLSNFSRKWQFRYYPAQSMCQRPGEAIFSKSWPNGRCINSRSNGRFINARPNGRFIKVEATGRPHLQISATTCNFAIFPHNQFMSGRAKLFSSKSRPNGSFINARPNCRFNNG